MVKALKTVEGSMRNLAETSTLKEATFKAVLISGLSKILLALAVLLLLVLTPLILTFYIMPVMTASFFRKLAFVKKPSADTHSRMYRAFRREVELRSLLDYPSLIRSTNNRESSRVVEELAETNPYFLGFMLSSETDDEWYAMTLKVIAERLNLTDSEDEAEYLIEALYLNADEISYRISNMDLPENYEYRFFTPYFSTVNFYKDFVSGIRKLKNQSFGCAESQKVKTIYNAAYRPMFHLKVAVETEEALLLPKYMPSMDTVEGLVYEIVTESFRRENLPRSISETVKEYIEEHYSYVLELPEEWRLKTENLILSDVAAEHKAKAHWSENEFSSMPLTYSALSELRQLILRGDLSWL